MKKIISRLASLAIMIFVGGMLSSCIKDLEAYPFNEDDFTSENAYGNEYSNYVSGLAKIYRNFNSTDGLKVDDAGASELIRAWWCVQECSTDSCKNDWEKDAWTQDINLNTWSTADNAATYALYCRSLHSITYVNEYLRQTTDERLTNRGCSQDVINKVHGLRAEARFIRAYMYYMLIDTFGDSPFVTEESEFGAASPEVKSRSEIFDYIESELVELSTSADMPEARSNYPRVDKGAVWALLSRLYLNAEIYNATIDASGKGYVNNKGKARWDECMTACEKVFTYNYGLCSNYFDLFRGDNAENPDSNKEIIFGLDYDAEHMRSWGGTIFMAQSQFTAADDKDANGNPMYSLGVADGWSGIRMPSEYVRDYFGVDVSATPKDAEGKYVGGYSAGDGYKFTDKRASQFFIKGHYEVMSSISEFTQGWSFYKFNNIPHDKTREEFAEFAATYGSASARGSIDWPLIRLAEIYLNYAEACVESNQASKGLPYLNAVRERAGLDALASYTLEDVQKERAVELSWEGFRRIDLIRWDLFHTGTFIWKWKGGSYEGQSFPEHMLVFDFPQSEITANTNLSHKAGYANN